jgi:O-antigen/teichoic acid export membrane protein
MTPSPPSGPEPDPAPLSVVEQPSAGAALPDPREGRFKFEGSLRERAARGALINSGFLAGLAALSLLKGFVLAGFLTRSDYGLWGLLVVSLGTLLWLKQVGIGDKYVQQDELDQERAFQKAFTVELLFTGAFVVAIAAALPLIALLYDLPELVVPGLIVLLAVLASAFQTPVWVYYRRMQFAHQRALEAIDPVVAFAVSVALAVAGAGYWAFVAGLAAGVCASAAAAVLLSPFPLRLRYERGTLRTYASFSWPLFVASGASMVMAQVAVVVAEKSLGLAAVGVIALAATITSFTDRVDQLVTGTLYPAICAVKDRTALLYESFVKSNRLALMWAVPFGVAITLFCSDLVTFGIGERWRPAVVVLQFYGVAAALNHVGFNWTAYFRARAETRPIAVANFAAMAAFLAVGIPLILMDGLRGFALGILVQGLVHLAFRAFYLRRLFEGFGFLRHALRSFLPTIPAVAAVLLVRALAPGDRTLELALAELSLYALVTVAATWYLESNLLREAMRYLIGRRTAGARA